MIYWTTQMIHWIIYWCIGWELKWFTDSITDTVNVRGDSQLWPKWFIDSITDTVNMSKDSQLWLKWFTESNTYPLDKECFKSWVLIEKIQWLKHYSTGQKEDQYQWWPTGLTKISKMRFCWMGEDQISLMTEMIHWLKDWMWKEWYLIIIKNDSLTETLICWTGDDYVLIMIEMITDSNTDLQNKTGASVN